MRMDIILLGENSLRIKGKNASIIVNPTDQTGKTEAEAIVLLENFQNDNFPKIEGSRITIKGPGEYEVNGIKVSGIGAERKLMVRMEVDNVKLLIGSGESLEKIHDKVEGAEVVVINADKQFNYSILSSLEPRVLIVYGQSREEVKKSLGKNDAETVSKFSTSADKLPSEMQLIIFG